MSELKKSKILVSARAVFLRYGYKRVNMSEIAQAAGVSRPALYVLFNNKEEIFVGVFMQWAKNTIAEIETEIAGSATAGEKLERAFEIWAVRPFEMMLDSPEAKELIDSSFEFAQDAMRSGYASFETSITPLLASLLSISKASLNPERTAHVLASAVRGFKQTASSSAELRQLIKDLIVLTIE